MTDSKGTTVRLVMQINARYRDVVDEEQLRGVIEAALAGAGLHGSMEVGLVTAGDTTVRRLNRRYRGIDCTTDVLSFPLLNRDELKAQAGTFVVPPGEPLRLGDIVISVPKARRQAAEYGHSVARELGYLAVHGTLHLLGYDHQNEADRQEMRLKEEAALRQAGLER